MSDDNFSVLWINFIFFFLQSRLSDKGTVPFDFEDFVLSGSRVIWLVKYFPYISYDTCNLSLLYVYLI